MQLDARPRDWQAYARQAVEFHLKNAHAWASAAAGQDLATQVDPDFTLGPHVPAGAVCLSGDGTDGRPGCLRDYWPSFIHAL